MNITKKLSKYPEVRRFAHCSYCDRTATHELSVLRSAIDREHVSQKYYQMCDRHAAKHAEHLQTTEG